MTEERIKEFWSRVSFRFGANQCWQWLRGTDGDGYGFFHSKPGTKTSQRTHRVAYELCVGPIPEGMELDHLCRNPGCVNPAHLEPVTGAENTRRGIPFYKRHNKVKTHCLRGHEYTPENTGLQPPMKPGQSVKRYCITCKRIRDSRRREE